MGPSGNRNTVLAELVGDSLNMKQRVIHLAELLVGVPVVGSGLGAMLHPLVAMLTLVNQC